MPITRDAARLRTMTNAVLVLAEETRRLAAAAPRDDLVLIALRELVEALQSAQYWSDEARMAWERLGDDAKGWEDDHATVLERADHGTGRPDR